MLHKQEDLSLNPEHPSKSLVCLDMCLQPQHCGEWRRGFPSWLLANQAPASVRDPASKECSGDRQSRTPNILLWPLYSHIPAHARVHTTHTCTHPKGGKDSTLVKTKPSKLFRGKGRGLIVVPSLFPTNPKNSFKSPLILKWTFLVTRDCAFTASQMLAHLLPSSQTKRHSYIFWGGFSLEPELAM